MGKSVLTIEYLKVLSIRTRTINSTSSTIDKNCLPCKSNRSKKVAFSTVQKCHIFSLIYLNVNYYIICTRAFSSIFR